MILKMIKIIFAICLLYTNFAIAIDKPGIHQLYSEGPDKSYLGVNCSEVKNDGSILCEFSKSSLSYMLEPDELINEINDIKIELEQELKNVSVTDLRKALCPNIKVNFEAKNKKIEAMSSGFNKDYLRKFYNIMSNACIAKTKNELMKLKTNLLILKEEKKAATCNVVTNHWSNIFVPIVTSGRPYWLASTQSDVKNCGMFNFLTLKKDGEHIWKYNSGWVIKNKNGKGIIPCDQLKQKDDNYSSKKKEYEISCKVFTFGF
jgi:hypothetical protein